MSIQAPDLAQSVRQEELETTLWDTSEGLQTQGYTDAEIFKGFLFMGYYGLALKLTEAEALAKFPELEKLVNDLGKTLEQLLTDKIA